MRGDVRGPWRQISEETSVGSRYEVRTAACGNNTIKQVGDASKGLGIN